MKNSIYQSFIRMYGMRTIYAYKVIAKFSQQDDLFNYLTERQVQLLYTRKDRHNLNLLAIDESPLQFFHCLQ